ncbi:hypothetical protein H4Q26_009743 [Puccinia striiformis f. sp. tritici PST-130]|nr:hypothetical protein H4Q26_009743 [Puccinia striiformis f. sp. tritici PST-130]
MLKEYFEISLIIVDFEDDLQEEALQKEPAKKSVKIKDPADQEDAKETATYCGREWHVSRGNGSKIPRRTRNLSGAKDPAPEPTAAIAALDEWGSWVPRQANIDEDNLQTNIGFGLTKLQRGTKKTTRKSFPGSWMEEDTVEEEASIGRSTKDSVPPLEKGKQPVKLLQELRKMQEEGWTNPYATNSINKLHTHPGGIVKITSQFLKGLQESLLNEEGPGKGANSGKLNCSAGFEEPDSDEEAGLLMIAW